MGYEYETAFEGDKYHLVKNKNFPGFTIEANQVTKTPQSTAVIKFGKRAGRGASPMNTLHESRFESFNWSPSVKSDVSKVRVPTFSKQKPRDDLFSKFAKTTSSHFYDCKTDLIHERMNKGHVSLSRTTNRFPKPSTANAYSEGVSSIDTSKVI